jgi:hypothetical protein
LATVSTPVHINRVLRQQGLVAIRREQGLEAFDPGASAAFAVADHQVAHLYVKDQSRLAAVRDLVLSQPGVDEVLDASAKKERGIDHSRAGDLVAIAKRDAWFTYYHWLEDELAPDYARTVDIHRKPGYDPVELFLDPGIRVPAWTVGRKLLQRRLGFRSLLDVIPLDASLVRGSHGRSDNWNDDGPLLITRRGDLVPGDRLQSTDVYDVILRHLMA